MRAAPAAQSEVAQTTLTIHRNDSLSEAKSAVITARSASPSTPARSPALLPATGSAMRYERAAAHTYAPSRASKSDGRSHPETARRSNNQHSAAAATSMSLH